MGILGFIVLVIILIVIFIILLLIHGIRLLKKPIITDLLTIDKKIELSRLKNKGEYNFNPSIVKYKDKLLVVYRNYSSTIGPFGVKSKLGVSILNKQTFNIEQEFIIPDMNKSATWLQGYEDPRVFIYDSKVYVLAVVPTDVGRFWPIPKMHLLTINLEQQKVKQDLLLNPDYDGEFIPQKNWNIVPWDILKSENRATNHCIYSVRVEPHNIVTCNLSTGKCSMLYSTSNDKLKEKYFRKAKINGGTKAVKINDKYVAICHIKGANVLNITYKNIFYEFSDKPPYQITRFSKEFTIPSGKYEGNLGEKIQMVTGLEDLNENQVIITVGISDLDLFGVVVNRDVISKMLNEGE
jgi:predicted GH43/DUF377 family glycosyl hydrolase